MSRLPRTAVTALALGLAVSATAIPASAATTTFAGTVTVEVDEARATSAGTPVSVASEIKASSTTQVAESGVCVEAADGSTVDFEAADHRTILTSGTWFYGEEVLAAGDYTATACVRPWSGGWRNVGTSESFTVRAAVGEDSSSPSGESMPTSPPRGWTRIMDDDFTTDVEQGGFPGAAYSSRWGTYGWGATDTTGFGVYNSDIISVSGGVLSKDLHMENGRPQVAALTAKLPGEAQGQLYGRYSVRFRADPVPGYKVAWLNWPDSGKWDDGEINWPEGGLAGKMGAFSHCADIGSPETNCLVAKPGATFTSWHTATTEWSPNRVTFYLDGKQIGTSTSHVSSSPMHWVLQTESSISGTRPTASGRGDVQIDWVTVDAWG